LRNLDSAADPQDQWIVIGRVRKTVGLQGWLRVGILTDFPERFSPGSRVLLRKKSGEPEAVTVSDWREHFSGEVIELKFAGADDCDSAADFVNAELVIPKSDREKIRSNSEFYPDELEGMQVISPEGIIVGKVLKLESDVPCPYLLIVDDNSREVMVPFRKVFIRSIDRKTSTVKLVEPLSYHIPVE
jgi:16S rRNA processing protein RimM